jgi:hypothetical protein
MKVGQLKDELRKQNLPVNGQKDLLIKCLLSCQTIATTSAHREQGHQAVSGFIPNAE